MTRSERSLLLALAATAILAAQQPSYTSDGRLEKPADYRSWVHLGTSLGLQYGSRNNTRPPSFENVYVNPVAWQGFSQTGRWPEGTTFVLEIREALNKGSFAVGGQFQGEITGMELEVKDSKRFADGWAWFDVPPGEKAAKQFDKSAGCFACHTAEGAVEKTFVQFYPAAMDIAKEKKTLNESYRKNFGR